MRNGGRSYTGTLDSIELANGYWDGDVDCDVRFLNSSREGGLLSEKRRGWG